MLAQLAREVAEGVTDAAGCERKPTFIVMQPGRAADGAREALRERGLPYTDHPAEAFEALAAWCRRSREALDEPASHALRGAPPEALRDILERASAMPAGTLDETAAKRLLAEIGVPVNRHALARSADDAALRAQELGFPVVMKVASPDITHKSDVGGVITGVQDAQDARRAYEEIHQRVQLRCPQAIWTGVSVQQQVPARLELIIGARRDAQFGPVMLVGAGGTWVEILPTPPRLARAPMSPAAALRALESLPCSPVLQGYRGRPLPVDSVVDTIVRLSWLAQALSGRDFEFEVNPLRVHESGCWAVDARLRVD
jgi:acetyl-CoA synthetase (ADP-forming)